jgi:acetylserotonin N-methyltransferase
MHLWDIALGFMDAQAVLTAEELGLFNHIDGQPRTAEEVAQAIGLAVDPAERLLVLLCARGVVHRLPEGRYVNGEEASRQLVRGKPEYIGAMFHHVREDLYPLWQHLKETLVEQKSQWHRVSHDKSAPAAATDPRALRSFMDGMHAITYEVSAEFAAHAPEMNEVHSIVDIGGASGAFLIALAEKFPHLHGTVVDLPNVRPITEEYFRQHALEGRLRFHGADFFEDPLPAGADAYSLGFILHDWDTEQGSLLLQRIAEAVRPGGLLIIAEYLLNDDKTGPLYVARANLNMMVAARGRERTAREYAEWIGRFGFELHRIQPTVKGKNFLLARKAMESNSP